MNHNKSIWLVRTAALIALLVALQWATAGLGQLVTGSCVNAVLALAVLISGLWSGVTVALLSPFCAFLLGIGPKIIALIPAIAAGNLVLVLVLHLLLPALNAPLWRRGLGVAAAAGAKALSLYLLVVQLILPIMGDGLKPQQVKTFSAMFSWPQLVTALIGSALAVLAAPVIRKAIRK